MVNHLKFGIRVIILIAITSVTPISAQTHQPVENSDLPDDFPVISTVEMNSPQQGYVFIAPFSNWGWFQDVGSYIVIIDNYSHPVFYRKLSHKHINDFKVQPSGQLTYTGGLGLKHYIMNDRMEVTDSIGTNGFWTDFHEIIILPGGNKFLIGMDTRIVDMSQYVEGGQEDAIVVGHVVQEFDSDNDVTFVWNSWDHYDILDCEAYVDLTASNIDFAHINTVELDTDTSLLVLARNMNEITKIDRRTGEIIWRMGGKHNEFTFLNDTLQWGWPHDIRKIGDGLFSIFDNGRVNTPEPHFSSGVIYQIDEEAKTINQIDRFRNQPDVYGNIMGNFQLLENGNFLTGWGSGSYPDSIAVTEFNADGEAELVIHFNAINYRANRYNWQPRLFYPENDTVDFGLLSTESDTTVEVTIFNDANRNVLLTGYHLRFGYFFVDTDFPVSIPAKGSISISLRFQPDEAGAFEDVLTLYSQNIEQTERIGRQMVLEAEAQQGFGIGENTVRQVSMWPNPAKENIQIRLSDISSGTLTVMDVMGKYVMSHEFDQSQIIGLNISDLTPGFYFLELRTSTNQNYRSAFIRQ